MQAGPRGRAADRRDGRPLRPLPGLHGLRHRVPVRRAVRPAHRGHPGPGRAAAPPGARRAAAARRRSSRSSRTRGGCGCCAGRCRAYQPSGLQRGRSRRSGVLARLSPTLAAMESLAPPAAAGAAAARAGGGPRSARAGRGRHAHRLRAARVLPRVNAATARVLAMEGCDVVIPRGQGCCGALQRAQRARRARRWPSPAAPSTSSSAAGVEHVVVNAAGCGSSMKEYAELLRRRPGLRRARRRLRRPGPRRVRAARPSSARSPRGTRCR